MRRCVLGGLFINTRLHMDGGSVLFFMKGGESIVKCGVFQESGLLLL
jgi:hypothetical protein